MNCYVYIVECGDGSLYTGWTNCLEKRMEEHSSGKGAKYTRSRRPVKLVYFEQYKTKEEAMRREYAIKQLSRREKLALIASRQANLPPSDIAHGSEAKAVRPQPRNSTSG